MIPNRVKRATVGCTSLLAIGWILSSATEAVAQQYTTLSERSDYVGACRAAGTQTLTVYDDARLSRSIGTIPASSRVTLTGVLGNGTAQIKAPYVGWVQAGQLKQCDSTPNPTPQKGACRRLRDPDLDGAQYESLRYGLAAYDLPNKQQPQKYGQYQDGPDKGAQVYFTDPRQIDGKWVRVFYTSLSGNDRLGWVSLGTDTVVNFAECLPAGTRRPVAAPSQRNRGTAP